eukprot:COSAG01_NODE_24351_length_782_cov_0.727672_1_plen_90_part_10
MALAQVDKRQKSLLDASGKIRAQNAGLVAWGLGEGRCCCLGLCRCSSGLKQDSTLAVNRVEYIISTQGGSNKHPNCIHYLVVKHFRADTL